MKKSTAEAIARMRERADAGIRTFEYKGYMSFRQDLGDTLDIETGVPYEDPVTGTQDMLVKHVRRYGMDRENYTAESGFVSMQEIAEYIFRNTVVGEPLVQLAARHIHSWATSTRCTLIPPQNVDHTTREDV